MNGSSVTDNAFLAAGLASLLAAVVGGGLKAFGIEIPLLKSRMRQGVLAVLGVLLLAFGLGILHLPEPKPAPPVLINAWSTPNFIGVSPDMIGTRMGITIHVNALAGGFCESGAMVTIHDQSGGRFSPSNTTTVQGQLDSDHCEYVATWVYVISNDDIGKTTFHDMQVEVTKDGATLGTKSLSIQVAPKS